MPVIGVTAVFGTTQEGSVDDLVHLLELRDKVIRIFHHIRREVTSTDCLGLPSDILIVKYYRLRFIRLPVYVRLNKDVTKKDQNMN